MIADDAEVSLTFNRDHETLTVEVTKGNFTLDGFNLRLWGYFVSEAWSETTQKKRKR